MNQFLLDHFKTQLLKSYDNAEYAHEEILKDDPDNTVIVGHLSIASSYAGSAKSIYVCNQDELDRYEFDSYFNKFDIFVKEVMTNIRTDHNHQWSDIEFRELKSHYREVAGLFNIQVD